VGEENKPAFLGVKTNSKRMQLGARAMKSFLLAIVLAQTANGLRDYRRRGADYSDFPITRINYVSEEGGPPSHVALLASFGFKVDGYWNMSLSVTLEKAPSSVVKDRTMFWMYRCYKKVYERDIYNPEAVGAGVSSLCSIFGSESCTHLFFNSTNRAFAVIDTPIQPYASLIRLLGKRGTRITQNNTQLLCKQRKLYGPQTGMSIYIFFWLIVKWRVVCRTIFVLAKGKRVYSAVRHQAS